MTLRIGISSAVFVIYVLGNSMIHNKANWSMWGTSDFGLKVCLKLLQTDRSLAFGIKVIIRNLLRKFAYLIFEICICLDISVFFLNIDYIPFIRYFTLQIEILRMTASTMKAQMWTYIQRSGFCRLILELRFLMNRTLAAPKAQPRGWLSVLQIY